MKSIFAIACLGFALHANADTEVKTLTPMELQLKLVKALGTNVSAPTLSAVDGLYETITPQGIIYITKDGTKLIHGEIYDLDKNFENLTEKSMVKPRLDTIKSLENQMIVFKAKDEKHVITVFSDISCGYCRKLHSEVGVLNNNGVTVRYLAYPRTGYPSDDANALKSIWCAKDPNTAFDKAMNQGIVTNATCDNINIEKQYNATQFLGLTGTPAIIMPNGSIIPGYQPAADLISQLNN